MNFVASIIVGIPLLYGGYFSTPKIRDLKNGIQWGNLWFDHKKSISGNRSVCRYIDPPISGRGKAWTGGVIHTEAVDGKDFLKTELVKYIDKVFVGVQYDADLDSYGDGRAGIPLIGYKF